MKRLVVIVAASAALFTVGGIGIGRVITSSNDTPAASRPATTGVDAAPLGTDALSRRITALQNQLRTSPADASAWASLGLAYVQQAKVTVDPAFYPKAEQALKKSLELQPKDNFFAYAGQSALASGRHDFTAAKTWADKGIAVDGYNATLRGALADAQTQLGNYPQAFAAVQKMLDLRPNTASYSRASYVFELRGQIPQAVQAMEQAFTYASNGADQAFASYYLAQLAFDHGNPREALKQIARGLVSDPSYPALIEGRAKAEAALGMTTEALRDYADIVGRVPQPEYVIEYGELLQSVGRTAEAKTQYDVFLAEGKLFEANGVALDTDPTLYQADHGSPAEALRYGIHSIKIRPFIESHDAYAWALHANKRDSEALAEESKAMTLGTQNALFYFHLGMIQKSLGHNAEAVTALRRALVINPHFNPLHVPAAKKALADLGAA